MCGNATCPLAWRERLDLRMLCNELSEHGEIDLLEFQVGAGQLIYDVCRALKADPHEVLPSSIINRIEARGLERLWPTLTEAEDAEMIELSEIRQSDIQELVCQVRDQAPKGLALRL